jgi:hypothetical protein
VRAVCIFWCFLVLTLPLRASSTVTVSQLEQFLTSRRTARLSDAEIALRLSQVTLSEQLTPGTLDRIRTEASLGQRSEEQLDLLAAESIFKAPPESELPSLAAPDANAQRELVAKAQDYAKRALHMLPDFLAVRTTRYFTNVPAGGSPKHPMSKMQMHLTRESRREIELRDGQEVERALSGRPDTGEDLTLNSGLSSWGEFGAILTVVLGDSPSEALRWSRRQQSGSGIALGVFRYAIPGSSSHYAVDFCCYQKSLDEPVDYYFHDKPAYSGEIYVNPENGEIDRITLDASLHESDPVKRSAIAVQYGHIAIGEKQYVCPLWSIALSDFYSPLIQKIDGIGIERHLNETEFSGYHKFGSSARIFSGEDGTPRD